jgi:1-acyl-sn-glycerol-3-phosphate acyltransferase
MVVAAVFHTSNLDSVLMVLTAWATRTRLEWIVKDDWVKPPVIGHIIRALGGVPIDRSRSMNTVKQMANKFQQRDKLVLVIAPEGTRRKTNYWKTGFYWIAYEAGVPILLGLMDYGTRTIRLDRPLLIPSGDIEADMAQIWDALSGIQARYPERVSNMALRPSAKQRNQKLTTDVVSNQDTPPTEET